MTRQIALDATAKQQTNNERSFLFERIARALFNRPKKEPVERNPLSTEQKILITNLKSMR
ncbi:hypothetical protein [Nitratireductor sp. ZSWI3]|uniref:hypothetical protein n=1 Tax=Nitratireductor sp. ZSWI3 TaxID=2966359 RepID=UPI00214FF9AF|nr:hypothetical protein [Nitratireductor sp. ZSWI3]MCR4267290.1 hypothetical protein [Nitratireductor sp. ZSWI3]